MVLFALLGGLILNLMPCVLPVMGMKLNSILQAGSDRRAIRLRFSPPAPGSSPPLCCWPGWSPR
jgi:suppressor for copper-sensitivity B